MEAGRRAASALSLSFVLVACATGGGVPPVEEAMVVMVVTEFRELERIGPYAGFARGLDSEVFGVLQRASETWAVRDPGGGSVPETELRAVRLEGTVDFVNRNLVVTARLVDPATGGVVWENRYVESRIPDRVQHQIEVGRELGRDVLRQVRQRGR